MFDKKNVRLALISIDCFQDRRFTSEVAHGCVTLPNAAYNWSVSGRLRKFAAELYGLAEADDSCQKNELNHV